MTQFTWFSAVYAGWRAWERAAFSMRNGLNPGACAALTRLSTRVLLDFRYRGRYRL